MAEQASEQSIFLHAIGLTSSAERAAYLDEACRDNPTLRLELEALLAAHDRLASGLPPTTPELAALGAAESETNVPFARTTETVGVVLAGRYTLVEPLGEGGMGTVWMAEQTEPVKRLVAVKLIKEGIQSQRVIARFEAERQALAQMDHPNIARVFDAGTAPDGQPFFVMELVKGLPITQYCDEQRLTPRQRLELFVPVCQAIQHAHQKGVIHRDIKPSNVLIARYDDRPVPKVIDFGVAKATGQQLTEQTLDTGFGSIVGTLEYMSPEQASFDQLDVDTRSDVYSLGVLLYELLAGSPPFSQKELQQAGVLEMLRVIREQEPTRPSLKLSTAEGLPALAANRGTEPKRLSALVRGELDWIVMKALEKDRSLRYETASSFAADVGRYLSDESVQACPPSAGYRLRKFARRNRRILATAAVLAVAVLVVAATLGWAVRDREARAREETLERAARQAEAANGLELALDRADLFQREGKRAEALAAIDRAELLAGQAPPDKVRGARLAALKERLDAEARDQEFIARFEEIQLRVQSQVNVEENRFTLEASFPEIRDALRQYGIAIGVQEPARAAACVLGRPEPVRRNLIAALSECVAVANHDTQTRQWLLATLAVADNDAWRLRARRALIDRDWKTRVRLAREVNVRKQPASFLLVLAESLPKHMKSARLDLLRRVQRAHPAHLWANHRLAQELHRTGQPAEAIRYYTAMLALRPDNPGIYLNRGLALHAIGDVDAAIADNRQSVALAPQYAAAHNNLGSVLADKGQMDEAVACFKKAIELDPKHALAHYNLGSALSRLGKPDEAAACHRKAIELDPKNVLAYYPLGYTLAGQGKLDEAVACFKKAIELDPKHAPAHISVGSVLFKQGKLDEAVTYFKKAIELDPKNALAHSNLGNTLAGQGKLDEAIACYKKGIELDPKQVEAHFALGNTLAGQGKLDEAVACYKKAVELDPTHARAHTNLGSALADKGQMDEAIACYKKAIELDPKQVEAHFNLSFALRNQGRFAEALQQLKRLHELGSKQPNWRYPSAQWVKHCQRLLTLDSKLPAILQGKAQPQNAAEQLELADLCLRYKKLNVAAARFYAAAFAAEPKVAGNLESTHRYNAACAAVLASAGQGKDAAALTEQQRADRRKQALAWLGADLAEWARRRKTGTSQQAQTALNVMRHWQEDPDLAPVRDSAELKKLPEAERAEWSQFWSDVQELLDQAAQPAAQPPGGTPLPQKE